MKPKVTLVSSKLRYSSDNLVMRHAAHLGESILLQWMLATLTPFPGNS